jgi:hypothetical protein
MTNGDTLGEWLINSMRYGSFRARNELLKLCPVRFTEAVAKIEAARQNVAFSLTSEDDSPFNPEFFDLFPSLDPAARALLSQTSKSRLYQAAYLGLIHICKTLLEKSKFDVNIPNSRNKTLTIFLPR